MKKYIVEIEFIHGIVETEEQSLFRICGIDHLVFDKSCLDNLEPLERVIAKTHEEAYKMGYEEGFERGKEIGRLESTAQTYEEALHDGREIGRGEIWDAVKMLLIRDENKEYNHEFGGLTTPEIMRKYSPDEIIKKLGKISEIDKVQIGDEVELAGKKVVITRIPENDPQRIHYIDASGRTYANNAYAEFKKTGRHFPIEDLLGQMEVPKE